MSVPPPADLVQALSALYGTDPTLQQQANAWLEQYSATATAWDGALSLISPAVPLEAQFFGCNMLLTKVRRDWSSLGPHESQHITQRIRLVEFLAHYVDPDQRGHHHHHRSSVRATIATMPPLVADRWHLVEAALAIAAGQVYAAVHNALQALGSTPSHSRGAQFWKTTPFSPTNLTQPPCGSLLPLLSSWRSSARRKPIACWASHHLPSHLLYLRRWEPSCTPAL